jgi:type II secretory pathway component PulF
MKLDEFAFVNQQLAGMLRSGIPLEGALQQLCATMARGELRGELEALRTDLATGTPLPAALAKRRLPPFYVQMLRVGVASNDLPGVLTLVADYYQHSHSIWTRLKGVMVYPVIVLVSALGLAAFLTYLYRQFYQSFFPDFLETSMPVSVYVYLWLPFVLLATVTVALVLAVSIRAVRVWLSWTVSPFKEAGLANLAATLAVLLRGGCSLDEALAMVAQLEQGTPLGEIMMDWRAHLVAGQAKGVPVGGGRFALPALFVWLVNGAGEDLPSGLQRAAEIYRARAVFRMDLLLYAALPVATLVLGSLIFGQIAGLTVPLMKTLVVLGQ